MNTNEQHAQASPTLGRPRASIAALEEYLAAIEAAGRNPIVRRRFLARQRGVGPMPWPSAWTAWRLLHVAHLRFIFPRKPCSPKPARRAELAAGPATGATSAS